jgi:hypothetical protein
MSNMTLTEEALIEALSNWATKQGIVLVQTNPFYFMQVLRERGLEIVKSEDLMKIRYEHKYLREEISKIYKTASAAKTKIQQLDENKDLLVDTYKTEPKPEPKSASRKV